MSTNYKNSIHELSRLSRLIKTWFLNTKSIVLGGGVAANKELRAQMKKAVARELTKTTALYLPPAKLTTDNAAMIGAASYLHAIKKNFAEPENLKAQGNLGL